MAHIKENQMNCFLFEGLSTEELNRIQSRLDKPVRIDHGSEMYRCGHIGIILKGTAKIIRKNDTGLSVTMRSIGEGEIFGMASVFGEWDEDFSSITAVIPCDVIYISEAELKEIFTEFPQVSFNYIVFLSDRIRFLNRKIDTFSADNAEKKLYEFLVSQADESNRVQLGFGMAELARRLRIGRSSLYRSIDALENNQLVKRNKNEFIIL